MAASGDHPLGSAGRERLRAVLGAGGPAVALMVAASVLAAWALTGERVALERVALGRPARPGEAAAVLALLPAAALALLAVLGSAVRRRPRRGMRVWPAGVMAARAAAVFGTLAVVHLTLLGNLLGWLDGPAERVLGLVALGGAVAGLLVLVTPAGAQAAVALGGRPPTVRAAGAVVLGAGTIAAWLAAAGAVVAGLMVLLAGTAGVARELRALAAARPRRGGG